MEIIESSSLGEKNFFSSDIMVPNFDTFRCNLHLLFPSAEFCERSIHSVFHTCPSRLSSVPSLQTFTNQLNLDFLLVKFDRHFFQDILNFFHYSQRCFWSQHVRSISVQLLEDKDILFQFTQLS